MIRRFIGIVAVAATVALPAVAQAQGVVGGVNGVLGIDDRPRFHRYVEERHYPSYQYNEDVRVGAVLPEAGVTYYDVPPEYAAAREYRYTVVNNRTVLVDPRTHRIVEVIE